MKRFLNADDSATLNATPTELTDKNLFAYCDNNPVMRTDEGGNFWNFLNGIKDGFCDFFQSQYNGVKNVLKDPVGAYVGYMTDPWSYCPAGKLLRDEVASVAGSWNDICSGNTYGVGHRVGGNIGAGVEMAATAGVLKGINVFSTRILSRIEIGRISGQRAAEGFLGVRYKTSSGPAFSLEFHSAHQGHGPHIQINKWIYQMKGYKGIPYRQNSWHFDITRPWKGFF